MIDRHRWEVKITHYYREANQVTDKLANMGVNMSLEFSNINSPPTEARELLFTNKVGVAWPRQLGV